MAAQDVKELLRKLVALQKIDAEVYAFKREIKEQGDGWTIVTKDRSLSAQWEHTVLVTDTGYEVLTLSAGSPPPPAFVKPQAA